MIQAIHQWAKRNDDKPFLAISLILSIVPTITFVALISKCSLVQAGLLSFGLFYLTLSLSIFIYRISFLHPLWKIPGPLPCKITRQWLFWKSMKGKGHLYIKGLHEKYGSVVRIGE